MLLDKKTDEEIILATKVSPSTIKRINQGKSHYEEHLHYPLR